MVHQHVQQTDETQLGSARRLHDIEYPAVHSATDFGSQLSFVIEHANEENHEP